MTRPALHDVSIDNGVWSCRLVATQKPELKAVLDGTTLDTPHLEGSGNDWIVTLSTPAPAPGKPQVVLLVCARTQDVVAHLVSNPIPENQTDLAREVAILRAELDLMKSVIRRMGRSTSDIG